MKRFSEHYDAGPWGQKPLAEAINMASIKSRVAASRRDTNRVEAALQQELKRLHTHPDADLTESVIALLNAQQHMVHQGQLSLELLALHYEDARKRKP